MPPALRGHGNFEHRGVSLRARFIGLASAQPTQARLTAGPPAEASDFHPRSGVSDAAAPAIARLPHGATHMSTGTVVQAEPAELHEPPPRVRVTEPFALVIFGATGDLAARKLLPALFSLWHDHFFAAPFAIIGVGR